MCLSNQHRSIKSYVCRRGRLTTGQRRALQVDWSAYGIELTSGFLNLDHIFGRKAARVLEVGFGNGESLLEQVVQEPQVDFIGIEVHLSGIGSLLRAARMKAINNLRIIAHDAVEVLARHLANESVDGVQIFFPDPWPKIRHHKRRLLQPYFLESILRILKSNGRLHCATDSDDYAHAMMTLLSNTSQLTNVAGEGKYYDHAYTFRPRTKFERRGLCLGYNIRDLVFVKSADLMSSMTAYRKNQ